MVQLPCSPETEFCYIMKNKSHPLQLFLPLCSKRSVDIPDVHISKNGSQMLYTECWTGADGYTHAYTVSMQPAVEQANPPWSHPLSHHIYIRYIYCSSRPIDDAATRLRMLRGMRRGWAKCQICQLAGQNLGVSPKDPNAVANTAKLTGIWHSPFEQANLGLPGRGRRCKFHWHFHRQFTLQVWTLVLALLYTSKTYASSELCQGEWRIEHSSILDSFCKFYFFFLYKMC